MLIARLGLCSFGSDFLPPCLVLLQSMKLFTIIVALLMHSNEFFNRLQAQDASL